MIKLLFFSGIRIEKEKKKVNDMIGVTQYFTTFAKH